MSNLKKILNDGEFGRKPRVNSKRKGSTFERKIAQMLNERFNTSEFCRTPGSGAFGSTHQLPQHLIVHGDLITPQNFRYTIECKNGYDLELDDMFKTKSDFYKFIEQAKNDARRVPGRDWMVIYKKNRRKEIVVVGAPLGSLKDFICIHGKYYCYLLKDVLALPESYWFIPTS
jgi:Holliday junction resolvase